MTTLATPTRTAGQAEQHSPASDLGATARRIVVGVNASPEAVHALRWAVQEAAMRDASVAAVHVFSYAPASWMLGEAGGEDGLRTEELARIEAARPRDVQHRAQRLVEDAVRSADAGSGVPIQAVAIEDRHVAAALVRYSKGAELLVLGAPAGARARVLTGSIAEECAKHAACQVTLVTLPGQSTPRAR